MLKPRIIVFAGYVGAGKSTQIEYLKLYLRRKGLRAKSTYLKTYFILTNSLLRLFNKIGVSERGLYFIHRLLVSVDLALNIIILYTLAILRIKIPSRFYDYILVEEYLPGTLVDYIHAGLVLRLNKEFLRRVVRILLRLLYMNSVTIILTCDTLSLPYRWETRGTPPESQSYLKVQERVFNMWSRLVENTFHVTTERSIRETSQEIRRILRI